MIEVAIALRRGAFELDVTLASSSAGSRPHCLRV